MGEEHTNGGKKPSLQERLLQSTPDRMDVDARAILDILKDNQTVLVIGELGDGKSSLLKRVAALALSDYKVTMINGHMYNSSGESSLQLFQKAHAHPMGKIDSDRELIIIDSSDYLYRSQKHAKGKKSEFVPTMEQVQRELHEYQLQHPNARFILTAHDGNWNYAYADKGDEQRRSLRTLFHEGVARDAFVYRTPSTIPNEFLADFLSAQCGFSATETSLYQHLSDPQSESLYQALKNHSECRKDGREYVLQLGRNPRILKFLFTRFPELRTALNGVAQGVVTERAFQRRLIHALFVSDMQDIFLPLMRAKAGSGSSARERIWGTFKPMPDNATLDTIE